MEPHEWVQRLEEYFDYARLQDERDKAFITTLHLTSQAHTWAMQQFEYWAPSFPWDTFENYEDKEDKNYYGQGDFTNLGNDVPSDSMGAFQGKLKYLTPSSQISGSLGGQGQNRDRQDEPFNVLGNTNFPLNKVLLDTQARRQQEVQDPVIASPVVGHARDNSRSPSGGILTVKGGQDNGHDALQKLVERNTTGGSLMLQLNTSRSATPQGSTSQSLSAQPLVDSHSPPPVASLWSQSYTGVSPLPSSAVSTPLLSDCVSPPIYSVELKRINVGDNTLRISHEGNNERGGEGSEAIALHGGIRVNPSMSLKFSLLAIDIAKFVVREQETNPVFNLDGSETCKDIVEFGYPHVEQHERLPEPKEKEKRVSWYNIGKDLTKVCLLVYFNEPISSLQTHFEDMEYSHLLD
eukprot:Gb_12919 [translate_table: standard]